MKLPKVIVDQIDRSVNPNRKLGTLKLDKPVVIGYKTDEVVENPTITTVTWKKRYYSYDRGQFYVLSMADFFNFYGKIYRTNINGEYGNFTDFWTESYSNTHYSLDVYVEQSCYINMSVLIPYGTLAIYINQEKQFSSPESSYYISGEHAFILTKGWNTIDMFIYHQTSDCKIVFNSNLGKKIEAAAPPDFTPPDAPTWDTDDPISSEYVNPEVGPERQVVLRWINDKHDNPSSNIRGWGIYRKIIEPTKNTTGSYLTAVSGWNTNQVVITGDYTSYFPSDMQFRLGHSITTLATVSGTVYDADLDQTRVTTKNTSYDYGAHTYSGVNSVFIRYLYKHISDVGWDATLPRIVSGFDNKNIKAAGYGVSQYFTYALDAYDDSPNINRSEKSTEQSVNILDITPPPKIVAADIISTTGGFKRIACTLKKPSSWATPANDVVGVRVWNTANPDPENNYSNEFIDEIPFSVSGSAVIFDITHTISGGIRQDLADKTSYTFYLSTYDWFGLSTLTSLPSITATTTVEVKTNPSNSRIEFLGSLNCLRVIADL